MHSNHISVEELKLMAQPFIFLFNGPPGSGKDTLAGELASVDFKGRIVKFAGPIKRVMRAIYGAELFDSFDTFEKKGIKAAEFFGQSCRDEQIAISEDYLKPRHGEGVFGQLLNLEIDRLNKNELVDNFYVSDSGFRPEAEVLVEKYGADRVFLFQIHRPGHTFEGDSRSYIDLSDLGVSCFALHNTGTVADLRKAAFDIIQPILNNRLGAN